MPDCGRSKPKPEPNASSQSYYAYFTDFEDAGRPPIISEESSNPRYWTEIWVIAPMLDRLVRTSVAPGPTASARDEAARRVMWLTASMRGNLQTWVAATVLFWPQMRSLGWQVEGVEPDAHAVDIAASGLFARRIPLNIDEFAAPVRNSDGITR